ncbi:GTPase subunit of restriction endonuclease [Thermopolyspora flexuosa]|uniref:5-methylcytosine-specific restriction protein B n=1 Tax=Thermopolyspora flexuosa TaxID=103836 RepID=A0A543J3Q4_9ACTN|nr:AAA family ATPase [Thermopolyspora flexuosa]TQM77450.1 5-methylcytosine-specific restriction protein B [Thermopolyspora flexuosa]GGM73230.1 GTPase subunit of restriction endonuclease [Thermopolyspora flexuosa]
MASEPISLLLRTTLEVLRDADGPLTRQQTMDRVEQRVKTAPEYLAITGDERRRWQTRLGWKVMQAAALGWVTRRNGWAITEAGLQALEEHDSVELSQELRRQYRAKRRNEIRKRHKDPRWMLVAEAMAHLEAGTWTGHGDLAKLAESSWNSVWGFLRQNKFPSMHRVLLNDGTVPRDFQWPEPGRTDDPREVLKQEGITFDPEGRANPAQRLTTEDFREMLADVVEMPSVRRAWLVRGSSVDGRDLVPVWLRKNSVSLAAANLREITLPIDREQLKQAVDEGYQHKTYAVREAKLAEFDAFCNRMRPGDYVLTTTNGKAYVGRITGDARYVCSSDQRSNLRRTAEWLNETRPVPFAKLPRPLPARLHNQADVVELTEDIDAIEALLNALGIDRDEKERGDAQPSELAFPALVQELAEETFIDLEHLQRIADLLWENKQIILYGPPGTGKTFLARRLANRLAEPAAVKLVQFHPSYTYEDFFEGFRPEQGPDGQLTYRLRPGPFRRMVEAAREDKSAPYILIIDEINRANLAKVFGELYFLLEYRDDSIGLLYSPEDDFTLPKNLFIIGTMNTTDRSIALVDAAMRRRFRFVELHPENEPVKGILPRWLEKLRETDPEAVHNLDAPQILDALNARIEDRDLAIGPSYLMKPEIYRRPDGLQTVWETAIEPLLAEYHYGRPGSVLDRYRLSTLRKELAAATGIPA